MVSLETVVWRGWLPANEGDDGAVDEVVTAASALPCSALDSRGSGSLEVRFSMTAEHVPKHRGRPGPTVRAGAGCEEGEDRPGGPWRWPRATISVVIYTVRIVATRYLY